MLPLLLTTILGSLLCAAGLVVSDPQSLYNGHVVIGYVAGGLLGAAIQLLYVEWLQHD